MPSIALLPASHGSLTPALPPLAGPGAMDAIARSARRDGSPSWHVELQRGGRRLHMHFADHSFGSQAAALAVAQAWRDAVLAVVPPLSEMARPTRRTRHQAEGLPGLYRITRRPNWSACWMGRVAPPGERPRTRSYNIARYGEKEARTLAEAWLLEQRALVEACAAPARPPAPAPQPTLADEGASYGISRVVSPKGRRLWQAVLMRSGRRVQTGFPDLIYGGEEQALTVARAWRDAVMAAVPPLTNIETRQIVRCVRQEGMPGVYYDPRRRAWSAVVTLPGRRAVKQSFKVSTHGEEKARGLAEAERLHMLDTLENGRDPALRNPEALTAAKRDFQPGPNASRGHVIKQAG